MIDRNIFQIAASADQDAQEIVIYDGGFDQQNNLAQIMAHELAHRLYQQLPENEKADYRSENGWYNIARNGEAAKWYCVRKSFVDPDGGNSPDEDFSNNVEYYLFNPLKLKQVSPTALG